MTDDDDDWTDEELVIKNMDGEIIRVLKAKLGPMMKVSFEPEPSVLEGLLP